MAKKEEKAEKQKAGSEEKALAFPVRMGGIMLGCDPEFFLYYNGEARHDLFALPASEVFQQQEVEKRAWNGSDNMAFRDGWAVELNVSPGMCRETLTDNIINTLHLARARVIQAGRARAWLMA